MRTDMTIITTLTIILMTTTVILTMRTRIRMTMIILTTGATRVTTCTMAKGRHMLMFPA